jgi:hypothetical protein
LAKTKIAAHDWDQLLLNLLAGISADERMEKKVQPARKVSAIQEAFLVHFKVNHLSSLFFSTHSRKRLRMLDTQQR